MAIVGGLITLADAKASLGIPEAQTANDADIEKYVEAATPVIENITGPLLAGSRTILVDGGSDAILLDRFTTVTSITAGGIPITGYAADPAAGIIYANTATFPDGIRNVTVEVTVGAEEIPANVLLATRELVRHWWQLGRQGNRPAFGNEGMSEAGVPSGFAVPRRVLELLEPNRRTEGFA